MSDYSQAFAQTSFSKDQLDDPLLFEYVQDFSGGEDSFHRSTLINANQCQHLLNVMVRDNYEARTRPGADAIPAPKTPPIATASAIYSLRYFDTPTVEQLLASLNVGGSFKLAKYAGGAWTDITAGLQSGFANVDADTRLAWAQGVDKLLISGGTGQMQAYDGTRFTNAGTDPQYDAPASATILCWHTARMFAAGLSTADDTIWVSVLLPQFVPKGTVIGSTAYAGDWDSVNRSFRVGTGDGDPIVALASMQDTTLCVLKRNSVWLVNTDPSQDPASNAAVTSISGFTAAAIPGNIGYGIGCVGRDAWCSYGNDILFMAQDGVRSVQRMQAAAGQWQLSAPISEPIQPYIARINQSAWDKIVAIKYQEFAFFFVPLDNSATNNYVLVWNGRLQVWMGAWTNWSGQCVEVTRFNGTQQFVFGDSNGLVNQWKDLQSNTDDNTYLDNNAGYPTQVWTRSFQFGDPILNKTAYNTILRFTAGNANVQLAWLADLVDVKDWQGQFAPSGDILGTGTLPFLLQSDSPSKVTKGIRGLPAFNEAYLQIQTTAGWFWLKNITASAFINPLKET